MNTWFNTYILLWLASLQQFDSNDAAVLVLGLGKPYWTGPGFVGEPEGKLMRTV